jgi:ubiquitin-protein ligase
MNEQQNKSRTEALARLLQATSTRSARALTYTTALLGMAALVPSLQLPPELAAIAGGIGVEAIGNLLDRAANKEISNDELLEEVTRTISSLDIDKLLTRDDFYHAFAHLRKGQQSIATQNEYMATILQEIERQVSADPSKLKLPTPDINKNNLPLPYVYRLEADAEKMRKLAKLTPDIAILEADGNPPSRYLLEFRVKGITKVDENDEPVYSNRHIVEMLIHRDYPMSLPFMQFFTPIFHPNIFEMGKVCMGWVSLPYSLVDICIRLGRMIDYQVLSPNSPSNRKAADWAKRNGRLFPLTGWNLMRSSKLSALSLISQDKAETDSPSIRIAPDVAEQIFYDSTKPFEVAGVLIGSQINKIKVVKRTINYETDVTRIWREEEEVVLGYWRSRPRYGTAISKADSQALSQMQDNSVLLIVDPYSDRETMTAYILINGEITPLKLEAYS